MNPRVLPQLSVVSFVATMNWLFQFIVGLLSAVFRFRMKEATQDWRLKSHFGFNPNSEVESSYTLAFSSKPSPPAPLPKGEGRVHLIFCSLSSSERVPKGRVRGAHSQCVTYSSSVQLRNLGLMVLFTLLEALPPKSLIDNLQRFFFRRRTMWHWIGILTAMTGFC